MYFFLFCNFTFSLMNALVNVNIIRENGKLHEMKKFKNYVGFLIHKIKQILKCFTGINQ